MCHTVAVATLFLHGLHMLLHLLELMLHVAVRLVMSLRWGRGGDLLLVSGRVLVVLRLVWLVWLVMPRLWLLLRLRLQGMRSLNLRLGLSLSLQHLSLEPDELALELLLRRCHARDHAGELGDHSAELVDLLSVRRSLGIHGLELSAVLALHFIGNALARRGSHMTKGRRQTVGQSIEDLAFDAFSDTASYAIRNGLHKLWFLQSMLRRIGESSMDLLLDGVIDLVSHARAELIGNRLASHI